MEQERGWGPLPCGARDGMTELVEPVGPARVTRVVSLTCEHTARSKSRSKVSRVRGAAGAPTPESPEKGARPAWLLQLRHLVAGAWGTSCQGSGPREGQSPKERRTPGGAPVGAWGCPRDPFTVDPQHETPTQPPRPAVPVRGLEKRPPALILSPGSLSSRVQKPPENL